MKSLSQIITLITAVTFFASCQQNGRKDKTENKDAPNKVTLYSKEVNDSFHIAVTLPPEYDSKKKYPVVYLLDGNFYFDMVSATTKIYSQVGIFPEIILVSVGYRDIMVMDSLRSRDYTYPTADAKYEMELSGGADKFVSFIGTEVIPYIDKHYSTMPAKRALMGHSLGGLAVMYAFVNKNTDFNYYIAASPSLHYNDYVLLNEMKQTVAGNSDLHLYISYGGLEDVEDADEEDSTLLKTHELVAKLSETLNGKVEYKIDTFSNLGHLEAAMPGFLEGLKMMNEEQ